MSDDEDLLKAMKRGIDAQRGYADYYNWPDKPIKELGVGRDFAEAYQRTFGSQLDDVQRTPDGYDPPDLISAASIGIELTELVDQALIQEAVQETRAGFTPGTYRDWTPEQLRAKISEIIRMKDRALPKTPVEQYWLVIHTDEPGLSPDLVRSYLEGWTPEECRLIDRCFLLMSYFPGQGRPLFELGLSRSA